MKPSDFAKSILSAFRVATRAAVEGHLANGRSVHGIRDGRSVEVHPDDLESFRMEELLEAVKPFVQYCRHCGKPATHWSESWAPFLPVDDLHPLCDEHLLPQEELPVGTFQPPLNPDVVRLSEVVARVLK